MVPSRGQPPEAPEGYYRSDGDPYVFHPDEFDCDHKIVLVLNKPSCSCTYKKHMCGLDKEPITPEKCKECQDESKTDIEQTVDPAP